MDASIIVVRGGKTSKEALSQGAARMRQARGPVAGAVLNAVSEGQGYYYGRYGYYRRYEEEGQATGTASAPKSRRGSLRRKRAGQA
jgi:Mrp family chromosome partitioning ATPase